MLKSDAYLSHVDLHNNSLPFPCKNIFNAVLMSNKTNTIIFKEKSPEILVLPQ